MTGFAPHRITLRARLPHPFRELAVMGIRMAFLASQIRKAIGHGETRPGGFPGLVALRTRGCDVSTGQRKAGGVVGRQREGGGRESLHAMACLTAAIMGRAGELAAMDVGVAVLAGCQLDFIHRHHTRGDVALRASDFQVLALQRVGGAGVFAHSEGGGFESLHGMTRCALAAILTRHELALVLIRVAVQATAEG